jgi:hypothetical protein
MDTLVAPSGKFRYRVRKATFADQRERSRVISRDKWSYGVGVSTREAGYTADDLLVVETWSVCTLVEEVSYDKEGNESFKPINIAQEDRRYLFTEFENWMGEQELEDVIAMHEAVVELNPKWR